MSNPSYRRKWGFFLGLSTALAFALVSQGINFVVMPGVPLYMSPFGAGGNILLGVLLGAAVGMLAAWPENFFIGILLSSLIGWLAVAVASYFTGQTASAAYKFAALVIILVPMVGFFVPFMALFRWIVVREEKAHIEQQRIGDSWSPARLLLPAVLLVVAAWLGYFNLYPPRGQNAVTRMHQMIEMTTGSEALPGPLSSPNVIGFREKASRRFTIRWDPDESNRFAIPRPAGNDPASAVITSFDNGWTLVCIFTSPDRPPNCRGFDRLPEFSTP